MNLPSWLLIHGLPGCEYLWLVCVRCVPILYWSVDLGIELLVVVLILVCGISIVALSIKWTLGLIVGHLRGLKWLPGCKLPRCKLSGWLVVITEVRSWVVIWLLVIPLLIIIVIRSICRRWSVVWNGSSIFWKVS